MSNPDDDTDVPSGFDDDAPMERTPSPTSEILARSASGKEAEEKAGKASPLCVFGCSKNAMKSPVAARGAWH